MAPLVQPRPAKEDDITAVLGRFKTWNTSMDMRDEQESEVFTGLEEISYEEALGDRGGRRMLPRAAEPQADLSDSMNSAIESARDTLSLSAASQLQSKQAKPNVARDTGLHSTESANPGPMAAANVDVPHRTQQTGRHQEPSPPHQAFAPGQKNTVVRTSPAQPVSKIRKTNGNPVGLSPRNAMEKRTAQSRTGAPPRNTRRPLNGQVASSSRTQPTFKTVLEDRLATDRKQGKIPPSAKAPARTSAGTTARSSLVPWVQCQSVSLKMRVSAGEHATIKAGASEAGLPLAAYMRQCTLDVEVLRKLLKQTIADIRAADFSAGQSLLTAPVRETIPPRPARPGLLKRLKNAWLDKTPEPRE